MAAITIIEDGERARSVYVRDGDVTVFDRDRKFRFRCDTAGAETTWHILARITPGIVAAEARAITIEALNGIRPGDELVGRDEAGRTLVSGEILWIEADREWAVCEDGFWWMPI